MFAIYVTKQFMFALFLSVNHVAFLNVKMKKNAFTIFKVLKSNLEITINRINSSGTVHEEVYDD
jgi:hypothetical protein